MTKTRTTNTLSAERRIGSARTVQDIAEALGCSGATVSRALNNKPGVSRDLKKRIIDYCDKHGFAMNTLAKSLKIQHSRTLGIVLPTLASSIYQRMNDSIQDALEMRGYNLITAASRYSLDKECDQAISLMQMGVEGLVLVGAMHRDRLLEVAKNRHVPIVNTYVYDPNDSSSIGCDDYEVMGSVVDCLVGYGHRKIAYISGVVHNNDRVERRLKGVKARLREAAEDLREGFHVESEYSIQGGYVAMQKLLAQDDRCTAVICGSDVLAFGALSACRELGVHVPSQISVIGFDNQDFAQHLWPPLSSVETPANQMGQYAAEMMLDYIEKRRAFRSIKLKANIVIRQSIGPAHNSTFG